MMALACREPLGESGLAKASDQEPANAPRTAETLVRLGVLRTSAPKDGGEAQYQLNDDWADAVDDARRQRLKGCLQANQRFLLIDSENVDAFYELIANRIRPDRRLLWVARVPENRETALIVALDPELDEDAATRLSGELRKAEVRHSTLRLGRLEAFQDLRRFAAESLPGAFGDEDAR